MDDQAWGAIFECWSDKAAHAVVSNQYVVLVMAAVLPLYHLQNFVFRLGFGILTQKFILALLIYSLASSYSLITMHGSIAKGKGC